MNLSAWAFRQQHILFFLVVVLALLGVSAYFSLPSREDPKLLIREAVVTTRFPGMAAEEVDQLISRPLEEQLRTLPEIKKLRSISSTGVSTIHVEVDDRYFDLTPIWSKLRNRVEAAARNLPEGTLPPEVNDEFGDVSVVTVALRSQDFGGAAMFDVAEHLRDSLYAVEGTKRVDILGAQEERITIEVSDARMLALGLSVEDIAATLQQQNIVAAAGGIDLGDRVLSIEPTGEIRTVAELRELLVRIPSTGDVLPLRDIAEVNEGFVDPPSPRAYFNGEPALVLTVSMLPEYSVLDFGPKVMATLDELEAGLPLGYRLDTVTYQAEAVERAVYGVSGSVLQTLGIVLAVVILFLGWRTGLIVGSIVPVVIVITLAVMGFFEIRLQRMSLATLIIALGLLVDNGIVIAEDYKRRLELGESRDAALRAVGKELSFPLLSSTLTTVLVFLPLMLAEHSSGEYTRTISLVILISLSVSWVVAMTLTPVLCHRFIKVRPGATPTEDGRLASAKRRRREVFTVLEAIYEQVLRRTLRRPWLFAGSMGALLVVAMGALALVPQKFFPDSDRPQIMVYLDLPAGISTRETDRRLQGVLHSLNDREEFPAIVSHAGYMGFGGPRFVLSLTPIDPTPNQGVVMINVDRVESVGPLVEKLRRYLLRHHPEVDARVAQMYFGPDDSNVLKVQLKGPDRDFVYQTSRRIEEIVGSVPGAIEIRGSWENRLSKLAVVVDQHRARRAGVSSADVDRSISTFLDGRPLSEVRDGNDIYPIVARGPEGLRHDLDRLKSTQVYAAGAGPVSLLSVADFRLRSGYSRIEREDLVPTVTVEARNTEMTAEDMVRVLEPKLAELRESLPPGHSIEYDGVISDSTEGQAALSANVPLCFGLMVLLLIAQFRSYRRPAIILMTIPLIMVGVAVGLHVMGADLGFMVILGIYALAGIIINNAIVLIDRIELERKEADGPEALVRASVRRLRPIVMTTVTTILGLLPLIVFRDALFYGMASVMAFGLLVGTVLTLGFVPVMYRLFFAKQLRTAGSSPKASGGPMIRHA
ncbi:MAG: efflux RND transporter permease subunit [Myxococcota bacterium]